MDKTTYTVPSSLEERQRLRALIARFIDDSGLIPPVTREQLTALSQHIICDNGLDATLSGWLMVEINNRLWRHIFSSIPPERRILLLPKCMSASSICTAEVDELGLMCRKCGACSIASLEDKAAEYGVQSIVAEGFTPVLGLFESGAIDAVIGVGCLESLEKVFPLLVDNAAPGMAIALNCAGCRDTDVDAEYVENMVGNYCEAQPAAFFSNDEQIKNEVHQWFTTDNLSRLPGNSPDLTCTIAREWLGGKGKRWRPYLMVSAYLAITGRESIPEEIRLAAIAIEAFHKASLIHDDIQDNDRFRYDELTVYAKHGVPIAINTGDRLLGDGYRLLAACGIPALVKEAATAHIALCHGQGLELEWCRNRRAPTLKEVIHIFENKTVPAFGVALSFAVVCAGGDEALKAILEKYACNLGIAFQLQDDIADFQSDTPIRLRPTSVLAAICEQCPDKALIADLLLFDDITALKNAHKSLVEKAMASVTVLAETYRQQAFDSLAPLKNVALKRLLFRTTKKVLFNS